MGLSRVSISPAISPNPCTHPLPSPETRRLSLLAIQADTGVAPPSLAPAGPSPVEAPDPAPPNLAFAESLPKEAPVGAVPNLARAAPLPEEAPIGAAPLKPAPGEPRPGEALSGERGFGGDGNVSWES